MVVVAAATKKDQENRVLKKQQQRSNKKSLSDMQSLLIVVVLVLLCCCSLAWKMVLFPNNNNNNNNNMTKISIKAEESISNNNNNNNENESSSSSSSEEEKTEEDDYPPCPLPAYNNNDESMLGSDISNEADGQEDGMPSSQTSLRRYRLPFYEHRNHLLADLICRNLPTEKEKQEYNITEQTSIMEFANSGGYFAKTLLEKCSSQIPHFLTSDFGEYQIKQSCRNIQPFTSSSSNNNNNNNVVQVQQIDMNYYRHMHNHNIITTISWEHITFDLELIEQMKPGTRFFFSLAAFPAKGHIRVLKTPQEIYHRYDKLCRIEELITLWTRFPCDVYTQEDNEELDEKVDVDGVLMIKEKLDNNVVHTTEGCERLPRKNLVYCIRR